MSKALRAAIEANDPDAVRKALAKVKDVNRKMPGARPPLLYAAEKGADRVLAALFDAGAVAEKRHVDPRETPFAVAAEHQQFAVMKRLLELEQASAKVVDHAVREAAIRGKAKTLDQALSLCGTSVTLSHFNYVSHARNVKDMLKVLIAHGGDVNVRDTGRDKGETPLHKAASGRHDVLRALVECGAEVNAQDDRGRTPLMSLAEELEWIERSESEAVALRSLETLLELGADATLVDDWGNDALAFCEWEYLRDGETNPKFEARLREAGAAGLGVNKEMIRAIRDGDVPRLKECLANGANPNRRFPKGGCPLSAARSADVLDELLEAGADPNLDQPIIDHARSGNLAAVQRLVAAGADIHAVNDRGSYLENAFKAADVAGEYEVVDYLKSLGARRPQPKEVELLEPGVASWNDFSEVLVKTDVAEAAEAVARLFGGRVELGAYGKTFKLGERAYVVARPKGMDWCNVFRVMPPRTHLEGAHDHQEVVTALAKATGAPALAVAYSDTSNAAEFLHVEPDGKSTWDRGWDWSTLQEVAENTDGKTGAWAKKELAGMDEDDPDSSERLVALAKHEKFVVAAFSFHAQPGRDFDVELSDYASATFDGVAFVATK